MVSLVLSLEGWAIFTVYWKRLIERGQSEFEPKPHGILMAQMESWWYGRVVT